jgi:hypothetical protein
VTNEAGDVLYEQWELTGMSQPVLMSERIVLNLTPGAYADADCNGRVNLDDYGAAGYCVSGINRRLYLGCEAMDVDIDGDVDLFDFAAYQAAFNGTP